MKDKSKLLTIIVVIVTILVVVFNYLYNKSQKEDIKKDINIVTNYSNFYTVNSCLYRTVTYISLKDKETLMKLISEEYKNNNEITLNNILNLFPNIDENSTFEAKKMYYENMKGNLVKFYVYGHIKDNQILDDFEVTKLNYQNVYFIVYLDFERKIFSVEPYDGELFLGGDNDEG